MRIFLDTANIDQIRQADYKAAVKTKAHIATVPYQVLMQMMKHPLTDTGIARFLSDWRQVSQK